MNNHPYEPSRVAHAVAPRLSDSTQDHLWAIGAHGETALLHLRRWAEVACAGPAHPRHERILVAHAFTESYRLLLHAAKSLRASSTCTIEDLRPAAISLLTLCQAVDDILASGAPWSGFLSPRSAQQLRIHAQHLLTGTGAPRRAAAKDRRKGRHAFAANTDAVDPLRSALSGRKPVRTAAPGALRLKKTTVAAKTSSPRRPCITISLPDIKPKMFWQHPVKSKRPYAAYADLPEFRACPHISFSKLYNAFGRYWVMTSTITAGGSGKVRYGFAADGSSVAIKEMRQQPKEGVNKNGARKTYPMTRDQVLAEAETTQKLRHIIDTSMNFWDELPEDQLGSLKKVRSFGQPFVMHEVIEDRTAAKAKIYLVMNKQAGDVFNLSLRLDPWCKAAVARSLAYQCFLELAVLHDTAGYVHGDLKSMNVLWHGSGQMNIMDFGLSRPLRDDAIEPLHGIVGSIRAPEMIGRDQYGLFYAPLTPATDVFALGAVVAEIAQVGDGGPAINSLFNPFNQHFRLPEYESATKDKHHGAFFTLYESWRQQWQGHDGRISPNRILSAPPSLFNNFFADLARGNPALCDTIVNDAMHMDPAKRATASEMAAKVALLLQVGDAQMQDLRQAMASLAHLPHHDDLQQAARAYDAFDMQCMRQDVAHSVRRGPPYEPTLV